MVARDRARAMVREAFPRRRTRLTVTRTASEVADAFRAGLVDAAVIDLGAPIEEVVRALGFARDFPSAPFFGITPLRPVDTGVAGRAARQEFADVLVDGVDDAALRELVTAASFTTRFAAALAEPPEVLQAQTALRRQAWAVVVGHAGRPVATERVAAVLGVTREHLSRAFGADGAPNLKRVMDLVRLAAAAELSKNPGYDVADVARVLGFASPSHLSTTAQRIVGIRPASLARLRTIDLLERFSHGRTRSRPAPRSRRAVS